MSHLSNIVGKELRELITKSTLIPIIFLAVLFGFMGNMMSGVEAEASSVPVIGLIDNDNGTLSEIACGVLEKGAAVVYNGSSVTDGLSIVEESGGTAVLVIPSNFTDNILSGERGTIQVYWIMKGAGLLDSISSSAVDQLLWSISSAISYHLIEADSSADAAIVLQPTDRSETTIFNDKEMEGVSPGTLSAMMVSQSTMVPILIMMIIMMAGSTVISSMGMEKENKTLETLLTLPVKRSSVVTGKLVASAMVGLLMAGIYMLGFNSYMTSFGASMEVDLASYGLELTTLDFILVGISLFLALLAALSMCMVLGTFAKNYKSAQTLTMPITFLAMIPMFITMFKDFNTLPTAVQAILFAIPFSHPMMAMRALLFDDYLLVIGGIVYVAAFAIVMILVAVWIFNTDRLLVGRIDRRNTIGRARKTWMKILRPGR
ncbi:MAG: ABC transporter permease [Thermoplasmata archaeon]|nr:ABC transporter permease [Thermoplasmata archaeon]